MNFLEAQHWQEPDAEITFLTDTSNVGLAFWCPEVELALVAPIKDSDICFGDIFFNEALAVVCAIDWAAHLPDKPHRILIRTDSMNTVNIFHSLAAEPNYVSLLLKAVKLMMDFSVDVWVIHIPGTKNVVADALSQFLFPVAVSHQPHLNISIFQPP